MLRVCVADSEAYSRAKAAEPDQQMSERAQGNTAGKHEEKCKGTTFCICD